MSTAHADKELTFALQSEVWGTEQVLKEIYIPHGTDLQVTLNYLESPCTHGQGSKQLIVRNFMGIDFFQDFSLAKCRNSDGRWWWGYLLYLVSLRVRSPLLKLILTLVYEDDANKHRSR